MTQAVGVKATTFRLEPELQAGLVAVSQVVRKPLNSLVNEAVRGYLDRRGAQIEADLEATLAQLRAYRRADPGFSKAIGRFAEAEATLRQDDPAEGSVVMELGPQPAEPAEPGPAQSMIHDLLRG